MGRWFPLVPPANGSAAAAGVPSPVTAAGPGAEKFTGQHPNTPVHDVVGDALGV